jgi:site-specific DNA-methyltransferase (adenine-specific)
VITPYYDRDGITIYCGDCREIVTQLGRFDLLLTDPPYGIDYSCGKVTTGKWTTKHHCIKIEQDAEDFDPTPFLNCSDTQIMWGANFYSNKLPKAGWLVWDKRPGIEDMKFNRSDSELAFFSGSKTVKTFRHLWHGLCRQTEVGQHLHPTQKPLALMKWCLGLAGSPSSVLDPFMGSGTTLVAAKELGIRAVGIELNERYCEIAVKRLAQGILNFEESV